MVQVLVNEEEIDVKKDSTVYDAIKAAGAPYSEDCKTILLRKKEVELSKAKNFSIETSSGEISVEIEGSLSKIWTNQLEKFENTEMGWETKDVVTFGPIDLTSTDLEPIDKSQEYLKWDVFIGSGGFDLSQAYLCFSLTNHEGVYGAPEENKGILGRIVGGKGNIDSLGKEAQILDINPIVRRREEVSATEPEDLKSEEVEEGLEILTCIESKLSDEAPHSAERFLDIFQDRPFHIDEESSTYVCDIDTVDDELPVENTSYRAKGSMTVRNDGPKKGSFYFYKEDVPFTNTHGVIGQVTKGGELLEYATPGDDLLVKTQPESLNVIGMSQGEASDYLSERGMKHIRVENKSDEAIVVEQRPDLTMEAEEMGSVATLAVDSELIISVEIWDDKSPESVSHFRGAAGLVRSEVGKLEVSAKSDEILLLSDPSAERSNKTIPVEENPSEKAEEGVIGVTNFRRRTVGSVGIRLEESEEYGPTGEVFEATNLVGRVMEGLEFIKDRKRGNFIYLVEEQK